jgi:hypothetical protein
MPRVIVTTDPSSLAPDVAVLLDEQVHAVHVSSRHSATQLVERIAWAITDAEAAERSSAGTPRVPHGREGRVHTNRPARRARARAIAGTRSG